MSALISDILTYFELVATEHLELRHTADDKHFFRMSAEEVLGDLHHNIGYPAFVFVASEWSGINHKSDNYLLKRRLEWLVVKKVPQINDYDAQHAAYSSCELIAQNILARMWHDRNQCRVFAGVDLNSAVCHNVGPLFDNAYGVRVEVDVTTRSHLIHDPSKWQ